MNLDLDNIRADGGELEYFFPQKALVVIENDKYYEAADWMVPLYEYYDRSTLHIGEDIYITNRLNTDKQVSEKAVYINLLLPNKESTYEIMRQVKNMVGRLSMVKSDTTRDGELTHQLQMRKMEWERQVGENNNRLSQLGGAKDADRDKIKELTKKINDTEERIRRQVQQSRTDKELYMRLTKDMFERLSTTKNNLPDGDLTFRYEKSLQDIANLKLALNNKSKGSSDEDKQKLSQRVEESNDLLLRCLQERRLTKTEIDKIRQMWLLENADLARTRDLAVSQATQKFKLAEKKCKEIQEEHKRNQEKKLVDLKAELDNARLELQKAVEDRRKTKELYDRLSLVKSNNQLRDGDLWISNNPTYVQRKKRKHKHQR